MVRDTKRHWTINRRNLLKTMGVAGAAGMVGTGQVIGIQQEDGQQTLIYAHDSDPNDLDPHTVDTTDDASFLCFPENAYETLVYFNVDDANTLEPHLASEVPTLENGLITNEGRSIEFPLRQGVMFHDGEEMTAQDVMFSWNRAMTMGLSPEVGRLTDIIESMEVVDDYTFRVELSRPSGPFLLNAVTRPVAAIVSQAAVEANGGVQEGQPNQWMSQNTAGTGPYMGGRELTQWETGDFIIWESHPNYRDDQFPIIPRVRQLAAPEISTVRALYSRGEIHTSNASADNLPDLEGTPGVKFEFFPSFDPAHITFNFDIPYDLDNMPQNDTVPRDFFQDPNVRLGFAYAFDYQTYIDQVWSGRAARMNNYHFPGQFGFDENAPMYNFDPERAEMHFREAGVWEEGFTITSFNEQLAQFTNGNLLLKDNIESLNENFTIQIRSIPESQMVPRHSAPQFQFPMEFHGFLPQGTDPDAYYRTLYTEGGSVGSRSRAYEVVNPRILELIDEAASTLDLDQRIELYGELQQLCHEDPAVIPVSVEELMIATLECVETAFNPAWIENHVKYWSIDNC